MDNLNLPSSNDYHGLNSTTWSGWFGCKLQDKQTIIAVTIGLLLIVAWKFYSKMSNNAKKDEPESKDKNSLEGAAPSVEREITTSEHQESDLEISDKGEPTDSSESDQNSINDPEFTIERGIKVIIRRGDITSEEVDVIVNAANGRLQHGGGVARAIAVKAGRGIDDEGQTKLRERGSSLNVSEVLHTGGYNLNAEYVLHAVGPIRGRDDKFQSVLKETFLNCLKYADKELKATSIAIPLISSGIFGGQKKECAEALVHSVSRFAQNDEFKNLKEIRLVNIDAEATDAIKSFSPQFITTGQDAS